jgi:CelD/BcsL family acetyltransferase involved in cellulose biosynthesis
LVETQVCTQTEQAPDAELQVELVHDPRQFRSMAQEWDRLVERADAERLFLSHTWLTTWWEAFGKNSQLHLITVRSAGELIAAAPMQRTITKRYGLQLHSIESIYNPHTPRFDFLVVKGYEARAYREIWKQLSTDRKVDMVVLKQINENSPTLPVIQDVAQRDGWLSGQWEARPSPYIPLRCDYEEFVGRLKGGYRYNLRKRYDRLSRVGPIDVEVITDPASVADALRDGLQIEAAAWKGNKGTAILSDPAATEFYTKLAEREAERGRLRLTFLRVSGKRISFSYIIQSEKTLYGVKIGYDPAYHTYSPGNTLLNLVLEDACAKGLHEYDFLGANDPWKYDWTREERKQCWLFLFRKRLRPLAARYVKFSVVPKAKAVLNIVSGGRSRKSELQRSRYAL